MSKPMNGRLRLQRSAIALATACLAAVAAGNVYAQSNATGSIFGSVQVSAGTTVLIENPATGFRRVTTPDSAGRIQATSLPIGTYKVTLMRDGKAVTVRENVQVLLGQNAEVNFGQQLETVTVTGTRKVLDVSNADSGASFTAKQLDALPGGRNVASIIALAPNTTHADPRYPGGASIGGGAASENSYYINGFPVTNPLNQLGSSELPFGAIEQAQILNGGFGAEFGRSIGGVINIVTKSGTNNWEAGGQASISPNSLRAKPENRYYSKVGTPTDGKLRLRREGDTLTENTVGGYVGGPLIKDRLFMFLSAEKRTSRANGVDVVNGNTAAPDASATSGWNQDKTVTTRLMGKFDLNLAEGHRLDLTLIGDTPKLTRTVSGVDPETGVRNGKVDHIERWKNDEDGLTSSGANVRILRYVGEITDNLTVTALAGQLKTQRTSSVEGANVSVPAVGFENGPSSRAPGVTYPQLNTFTGQLYIPGNEDKVKGLRLDVEYKLGAHTIKVGMDDNKMSTLNGGKQAPPGGRSITYADPLSAIDTARKDFTLSLSGGTKLWIGNPANGALAAKGYYGFESVNSTVSNAYSNQTAQYIEDRWQASKNLLLTAGLRRETYENQNFEKVAFLKVNNQLNPRFSAVWDVSGDASTKVFGSAGRYSIQIPTLIALRGANGSTNTTQVFTYTGVDANGMPTGRVNQASPYSSNSEYGQTKDPHSVAAASIKPAYQDEMILGIERALLKDLSGGVKFTHRTMKSTIDDTCDWRPFGKYVKDHPTLDAAAWREFITQAEAGNTDAHAPWSCAAFNPGRSNTFDMNFNGDGKTYTRVTFSADEMGYGKIKPKRTYTALDFFLEHPFRDNWYGKLTYTYSKSKGNTEGQTLSDRAQRDVSATMTWDHPEIMEAGYGYLPNDRRHQVKAYGYYQVIPELQLAGTYTYESGRPRSCLGTYKGTHAGQPTAWQPSWFDAGNNYGSNYHYCFGKASERGTLGRLASNSRLNLSVTYKPGFVPGLALSAEMLNVLDNQAVLAVEERGETNGGTARNIYQMPVGNAAPRSARFTATYNHAF